MLEADCSLSSMLSSFPLDLAGDVTVFAHSWHVTKERFGDSLTGLCFLLASCLNESFDHEHSGCLSVEGIGLCRNRDDVLVLNVARTCHHVGDVVAGDDWDATACYTLRYSVRRDGDRLVIRPMRRSDYYGGGGTGIIGWHLPNQEELAIRVWEGLLA